MEQINGIDQLAMALVKAQGQFPIVPKSAKNPHLKNSYATLDDIINAIRKPLAENGLGFVQLLSNDDGGALALRTVLLHESGQTMETQVAIGTTGENRGVNAMQSLGGAITYMKRYTLSAMLGIATGDDTDGESEGMHPAQPQRQPQPPQPAQQPPATQPPSPNSRPLPADKVRVIIRKKAGWADGARVTDVEPITEPQTRLLAILLTEAVKPKSGVLSANEIDNRRHAILEWLIGVTSTKALTGTEARALIDWLVNSAGNGVNEWAGLEAASVYAAWQESQEQTDQEQPALLLDLD